MKKRFLSTALVLCLILGVTAGCSKAEDTPDVTDGTPDSSTQWTSAESAISNKPEDTPEPLRLKKIPQIKTTDTYITVDEASSGYDSALITDAMISACTLPEATVSDLPYWTGFVLENKMLANITHDDRWNVYTDGVQYWYEGLIELIAQEGFNCARCMYSLTYLGKKGDPEQISENALAELDALISWGLKYNVHIMLSISGAPDCWGDVEKENVMQTPAIFDDPHCSELYFKYMTMLAKRYENIPAKVLSIELVAEPAFNAEDWDNTAEKEYAAKLLPTVTAIHEINSERILIANDLGHKIAWPLAEAGCALSLHAHIFHPTTSWLQNHGIQGNVNYPVPLMPAYWDEKNGTLTLNKEDGFSDCTMRIYYSYYTDGISITADGSTLYRTEDSFVFDRGYFDVEVPDGTKTVTVTPLGHEFVFSYLVLKWNDGQLILPAALMYDGAGHYCNPSNPEYDLPALTLNSGYEVIQAEPYGMFSSDLFYETTVAYSRELAKKYNVGFMLSEICGDNELPLEDYLTFEELETGFVKKYQIPWMWNCLESVISTKARIWPDSIEHRYRETKYEGIYIDDAVMDYIKSLL